MRAPAIDRNRPFPNEDIVIAMRAEAEALAQTIKQSVGLLRRHL